MHSKLKLSKRPCPTLPALLLLGMVTGPAAKAAPEAQTAVVHQTYTAKIGVALGDIVLILPKAVKSALLQNTQANHSHINSRIFSFQFSAPLDAGQPPRELTLDADIQAQVADCDGEKETAAITAKGQAINDQAAYRFVINTKDNGVKSGSIYEIDDFSHDSYNFIVGATDQTSGRCYSFSFALYDAKILPPKFAQSVLKGVLRDVTTSFEAIFKEANQ